MTSDLFDDGSMPEDCGPEAVEEMAVPAEAIQSLALEVKQLVVRDQDSMKIASDLRRDCVDKKKRITNWKKPALDRARQTVEALRSEMGDLIDPLDSAIKLIDGKILDFNKEEDRRMEEERRVIRAKREAEEREARRREADRVKKEAEDRANDARTKKDAEEIKREARQVARDLVSAPSTVGKIEVEDRSKMEGQHFRENPEVEILEPDAVPREYCSPDRAKLLAYCRFTKGTKQVPGCRLYMKKTLVQRG